MKLLLHICCANCAIHPVKVLREAGADLTGYFFNPNIHPYLEYRRRLDTVRDYAGQVALPVIYNDDYALEEFLANVACDPMRRCAYCYHSRLDVTARFAADHGFDGFSTALLYSRYQQHETIRTVGEGLARRYGIDFVYEDFRSGWQEGIALSRAMKLYRQPYCGCIYSEKERYHPKAGLTGSRPSDAS